MATNIDAGIGLSDEAKEVVWRIFGAGQSPLKRRSTFEVIEPIIRKYVTSSTQQDMAITTIRGWFEIVGGRRWLNPDLQESVADLILEGIGTDWSEIAVWAVSSINSNSAPHLIRARWRPEEIDSFVDAAIATLANVCDRDELLDGAGIVPFAGRHPGKASIPRDAVQREGRLETFRHLNSDGFDLVHRALHLAARNLIELVIDLRPERFESLICRLDHPVMQARATYHMVAANRTLDHRKPLMWINRHSCDALIALAITRTFQTVNKLDEDIRASERSGEDRFNWSTELRPPQDDLNAAAINLVNDLVDQLARLDPLACARWVGELLSDAPYALSGSGRPEKPPRIEQLERASTQLLVKLVRYSWSDDLLVALCAGLRLTPRTTWTRHLANVAWEVCDAEPERAAMIARTALDELDSSVAEEMKRCHLHLNWDDWHDREWIDGLGAAFALSSNDLDPLKWMSSRCQALPLRVWDAEESYQTFSNADQAAQIWCLVALHAVPALKQIDHAVDAAKVRVLAQAVWNHCHFVGQHLTDDREASVASEYAARFAVEFGEPSDLWLLEQSRNPTVGPRALWALIDQWKKKSARQGRPDSEYDQIVLEEVANAASIKLGDGGLFGIRSLYYWGLLWLQLHAVEPAHRTAKAILAFPMRNIYRDIKILALDLIAQGTDHRRLDLDTKDCVERTYYDIWPVHGYTPDSELAVRERIDGMLADERRPTP